MHSRSFRTPAFLSLALALTVLPLLVPTDSHARCSIRVADPMIQARFQDCSAKAMLSYLYNDLVTPYSFTCAKKLSQTCRKENCGDPKSPEEELRCWNRYAEVLNECPDEIAGAAKMARCRDTGAWPAGIPTVNPLTAPSDEMEQNAAAPVAPRRKSAPSAAQNSRKIMHL